MGRPHQPLALIVDDEPLVRMLVSDILEDAAFRVVEAASGEEAVAILEHRAAEIALIYSDIRMSEMSGFD
jgi:CheY-like chemotaxis protein